MTLAVTLTVEELEALMERAVKKASAGAGAAASEVLTRADVARILKVHEKVVSRYVQRDGLPAHRIGKELRFLRPELTAWIERQGSAPKEKGAA